MKKLTALLLALVMTVLLLGCNASAPKRGVINDDVYKNESLGFTFTKPSSWVFSTEEEIAQAMNVGVEYLIEDNYKEVLEQNATTIDMMAVDSLTRANINVSYENLAKSAMSNITEKQYIDATKEQLKNVSHATFHFPDEYETVTLGKTEFTRAIVTMKMSGITMTQAFYVHKLNGYMGVVTVTVPSGTDISEIEALFR